MTKYIAFLLLVYLFSGCSGDEERTSPPKIAPGKKPAIAREHRIEERKTETDAASRTAAEPLQRPEGRYRKSGFRPPVPFPQYQTPEVRPLSTDTVLIRKLNLLRNSGLEIDLREPVSREYLISPIETGDFPTMILLGRDRSIRINFDNDIFDNTDRYYTNGIRFDYISPYLRQFPLSWLMVPYWGNGINYYGLSICQNMYTPYTTKTGGIHFGDRPYAAYLYLGSFKISNDPGRKFRQTSELDIGVIGPYSFGDFVQKSFHTSVPTNNEPLGWEYQIKNDLLLNYRLRYEKGIVGIPNLELNLYGSGELGTLYTNLAGGFQLRAGRMNPYFSSLNYTRQNMMNIKGYKKFQAFAFLTSQAKLVGYDATLEGGMLNTSSIYKLSGTDLNAVTYQGTLGFTLSYAGVRLDVEQFLLSPEFHGCAWHKWVHIGLTFGM